ncbi:Imm52 family immunity protein [Archangium gephyra]|uniref:Imm52 family immunity protein n=1 Tax=Archangium gephyra TaxID=48 RepID=UPI003B7AB205
MLVRPDGYLVTALDGTPLQRLGPLELMEGEWRVGRLVVGGFYASHGGVFYPVTEALRRADGPPLAELGLGRDALNAALDGGQQALAEMALALAHFHPPPHPHAGGPGATAHHGGSPHCLLARILRALRGQVPGGPDPRGGAPVHARPHAARRGEGRGGTHGRAGGGAALTYLSRRLGSLPPLPAPVRIEPVGTLGWLLVLSPEPMTASNPEHVAFTARVRELLDRAGLIERPKPGAASP